MQNYDQNYGFKPISSWGYVGYSILWSIPVVGWIVWLCHALGASNRNVKNYARSGFCAFILSVILAAVMVGVSILLITSVPEFKDVYDQILKTVNESAKSF